MVFEPNHPRGDIKNEFSEAAFVDFPSAMLLFETFVTEMFNSILQAEFAGSEFRAAILRFPNRHSYGRKLDRIRVGLSHGSFHLAVIAFTVESDLERVMPAVERASNTIDLLRRCASAVSLSKLAHSFATFVLMVSSFC